MFALIKRYRPWSDYLRSAIIVSLLFHGAMLYMAWPSSRTDLAHQAEPEVVLVNMKNDEEVLNALLTAQWQAAGGGQGAPNEAVSAPFSGDQLPSPNDLVLQALKKQLRQQEEQQFTLLLQLESDWQHLQSQLHQAKNTDQNHYEQLQEQSQQLTKKLHVLRQQLNHYNSQPRIHFDAPSTKASVFAAYIEDWRAKVERLGTEHYPSQAKGQLSDSLQLTVFLDSEGHLINIDINQAANNPIFTVAAQRIVRLASPFAPFTPQMREQTDVLAITRSWRFTQGSLSTQ